MNSREGIIHCLWTIGVLILVIVLLMTYKLSRPDIATLIGVATGLVSLVVGIIAIIYSFVTSGALTSTTSKLEQASSTIQQAALEVSTNIKKVAEQVSEIHSKLPLVSQNIQSTVNTRPESSGHTLNAVDLIEYFLSTASWLGLLTLYAAIERSKLNKPFNAYTWTAMFSGLSPDYAIGYFVCASSAGIVTYDTNRFLQQGNIWITYITPLLDERISQSVTSNLTRPGVSAEELQLRFAQKTQTDSYISQSP